MYQTNYLCTTTNAPHYLLRSLFPSFFLLGSMDKKRRGKKCAWKKEMIAFEWKKAIGLIEIHLHWVKTNYVKDERKWSFVIHRIVKLRAILLLSRDIPSRFSLAYSPIQMCYMVVEPLRARIKEWDRAGAHRTHSFFFIIRLRKTIPVFAYGFSKICWW